MSFNIYWTLLGLQAALNMVSRWHANYCTINKKMDRVFFSRICLTGNTYCSSTTTNFTQHRDNNTNCLLSILYAYINVIQISVSFLSRHLRILSKIIYLKDRTAWNWYSFAHRKHSSVTINRTIFNNSASYQIKNLWVSIKVCELLFLFYQQMLSSTEGSQLDITIMLYPYWFIFAKPYYQRIYFWALKIGSDCSADN